MLGILIIALTVLVVCISIVGIGISQPRLTIDMGRWDLRMDIHHQVELKKHHGIKTNENWRERYYRIAVDW